MFSLKLLNTSTSIELYPQRYVIVPLRWTEAKDTRSDRWVQFIVGNAATVFICSKCLKLER